MTDQPLWIPDAARVRGTEMFQFRAIMARRLGRELASTDDLAQWALSEPGEFWAAIWDHFDVIGKKGNVALQIDDHMTSARFFPEGQLNYAENLLRQGGPRRGDAAAIRFRGEDKAEATLTWAELDRQVSLFQQALRDVGVGPGDRVAGLMPNRPEAIVAMLAASSIGAVWCSASPDFGPRAVLDRFSQIAPKILLTTDGYWYAGKARDIAPMVREVVAELPSLEQVVTVDYLGNGAEMAASLPHCRTWDDWLAGFAPAPVEFVRLPFDHPLFILFSSGTTGKPKCIVHRAGGVLLQHLKEHGLHSDIGPQSRLFYYTTLGWMMWNWLASGLARGATLLLYDGSPFHPGRNVLFRYAEEAGMTHFGTSAKYLDSLRIAGVRPKETHDLSSVRMILSTGSPLLPETSRYVYDAVLGDVHLASISGGTDIVSCFVLGDPTAPVWAGELQCAGLGLAVDVLRDDGTRAAVGEKGELVCTAPFPSMPLRFWADEEGARYRAAYFEAFDGIWCQGDFAERSPSGGFVIHGRSDATLNPGGVRIGTAEIYSEIARFDEITDAVVIGEQVRGDVEVVLFVVLRVGVALEPDLISRLRARIREGSSPRHVPARVIAVPDVPRTASGKVSELAVRDVVHGRAPANVDALVNPEALDHFRAAALEEAIQE